MSHTNLSDKNTRTRVTRRHWNVRQSQFLSTMKLFYLRTRSSGRASADKLSEILAENICCACVPRLRYMSRWTWGGEDPRWCEKDRIGRDKRIRQISKMSRRASAAHEHGEIGYWHIYVAYPDLIPRYTINAILCGIWYAHIHAYIYRNGKLLKSSIAH